MILVGVNVGSQAHPFTCALGVGVNVCTMYVLHSCIYIYIYVFVYTAGYMYVCMHVCTPVCRYVCVRACIPMCTHAWIMLGIFA